jgi:uncharacterized protein (DUF58 family)
MSGTALSFEQLFDSEFLRAVRQLRWHAHRVAPGGRYAEHKSRARGQGMEFTDFRPYVAGDDLRAIDWNIYRRLGKLVVKVAEEQRSRPLYLLPDISRSMYVEERPRAVVGLRIALALASVSLQQHDPVGLFPFAEQLHVLVKAKTGRTAVLQLGRLLAQLQPQHATRLPEAIARISGMNLRRGLLVVISDFFDASGLAAVEKALGRCRHRVLLIQLMRKSDASPALQGEVRVKDCESGEITDVTVTAAVLARYMQAYERFNAGLAELASRRQIRLLRIDVEEQLLVQLASLFASDGTAI